MALDNKTLKKYRTIGHQLAPVVIIASGLSANISKEISRALKDHELIKIKIHANSKEEKKALLNKVCTKQQAELVQLVGHVALIYKAAEKPNPKLSNLIRHKI